jgi:RHS repeat-associated protein
VKEDPVVADTEAILGRVDVLKPLQIARAGIGEAFDRFLGRVSAGTQTTGGISYPFTSYTYDLLDDVLSMGMPSGRTIATNYDSSGRPISVSGTLGANTTHYVSSVSYAPHGAPSSISLANGAMTRQTCFNSLLQPVVLRLRTGQASCGAADGSDIGYFGYTFSSTQNNGNVLGQAIQYGAGQTYASKSFQQTYSYTANRLMGVTETYTDPVTQGQDSSFTQSYQYDVVGNRWVSGGLATDPFTPQGNVYDGNNHMSSATYGDGRGNVTQIGGYTYGYDAENRLISSTLALPGNTISSATYTYDGDGRRVVKQSNGTTTQYVYDADGQLVAEYVVSGTGTAAPCTTCYLMADHLGSTRMMTDSAGNQQALYDYAPNGEELTTQGSRDARWGGPGAGLHFTGKEQEGSEGDYMHYFGARYYSGGMGRFTSPDPHNEGAQMVDPQSWNMYSYVGNNSVRYVDPDGQDRHVCLGDTRRGRRDNASESEVGAPQGRRPV